MDSDTIDLSVTLNARDHLKETIEKLYTQDEKLILESLEDIRALIFVCEIHIMIVCKVFLTIFKNEIKNDMTDKYLSMGLIPRVYNLLCNGSTEIQIQSARTIRIISKGDANDCRKLIVDGGLDILLNFLESPNIQVVLYILITLSNIVGESTELRDELMNATLISSVLRVINRIGDSSESTIESIRIAILWLFANFSLYSPRPPMILVSRYFKFISDSLDSSNPLIIKEALSGLVFIAKNTYSNVDYLHGIINLVKQYKVFPRLFKFLEHDRPIKMQLLPALTFIGDLLSGSDLQTQTVLDFGVFPYLASVVQSVKDMEVVRVSLWATSNIACGTQDQIKLVIDSESEIYDYTKLLIVDLDAIDFFIKLFEIGKYERAYSFFPLYKVMASLLSMSDSRPELEIQSRFKRHRFHKRLSTSRLNAFSQALFEDFGMGIDFEKDYTCFSVTNK
ncbi:hypothetical protein PPL_00616 [Heterostelium album PN500]|uniref:Importin subunit alpha n=1 Tax=Heterostelium pallidum (strain ATCC 26659 / Pp 5 / PN500) TaxID=670386 RepID=D3AWY8_HETP5|nr:hypothetical protein PPL_00616 [Heterostelium album PN500]EFA86811.1 hypothetical protein PPL_00616 [Heterostelium album PN500]|eukprot:XP_020438914.1 hypothetical protein PPL_00616 [Heterostelium album PN500]